MDQRYEHVIDLEGDGEYETHILFCTIEEGQEIAARLKAALPGVNVLVEAGGEYDYTTEDGTSAETIAADILDNSGFNNEDWLAHAPDV